VRAPKRGGFRLGDGVAIFAVLDSEAICYTHLTEVLKSLQCGAVCSGVRWSESVCQSLY
jgi:hypothetical protein